MKKTSTTQKIIENGYVKNYPSFLINNIHYEVMMGSVAYGVSNDMSDVDIYGFCVPPEEIVFPYRKEYIYGFGQKPKNFEQYQAHHIQTLDNEYDIVIYNIVKYFQLCMDNNPNMVDSLFVPDRCVLYITDIGRHVRDNRRLFLSKKCWHKFKGYAFSQLHKLHSKHINYFVRHCEKYDIDVNAPDEEVIRPVINDKNELEAIKKCLKEITRNGSRSKRIHIVKEYGYDVKFAYHVVRLIDECQQILEEHDLDLTRSRNHLKAIRNGLWSIDNIEDYFNTKLKTLEEIYSESTLRYSPDEGAIKKVLMECLEMQFGTLYEFESASEKNHMIMKELNDISGSIDRIRRIL